MIKGIIFDLDGLIIDTEVIIYETLNGIFKDFGSELPVKKWQKQIGTHNDFSPFAYLEERTGLVLNHKSLETRLNHELYSKLSLEKARPGVEEYLNTAKKLGMKIGLASSSSYDWVSKYLKNMNLLQYFDCIKTSDNVKVVKPDPALYILTVKCLQLKRNECLVFEDSANGALAAKRAGVKCVIVPNQITKNLNFCDVDYRMESMTDKDLEQILKLIDK